jgi:hypothetical protein
MVPHWDELFEYNGFALDSDDPTLYQVAYGSGIHKNGVTSS